MRDLLFDLCKALKIPHRSFQATQCAKRRGIDKVASGPEKIVLCTHNGESRSHADRPPARRPMGVVNCGNLVLM